MKDALRLLPDLLTLLRRLTADQALPRGIRVRLLALLIYLASPIDLVPDFLPVIGNADDAIIVALILRSGIRRAGIEALERHWPGTPAGLTLISRLAGTAAPTA
ncbi:YkvA family protein [Pseudarthrobacter sp. S9]|uniref:YkvA family protein n=1 Tax=Pseudarthrobacter sp. S9 TaxID=3418421 RepID=UPI003D069D8C